MKYTYRVNSISSLWWDLSLKAPSAIGTLISSFAVVGVKASPRLQLQLYYSIDQPTLQRRTSHDGAPNYVPREHNLISVVVVKASSRRQLQLYYSIHQPTLQRRTSHDGAPEDRPLQALASHVHQVHAGDTDICPCSTTPVTAQHILQDCQPYHRQRVSTWPTMSIQYSPNDGTAHTAGRSTQPQPKGINLAHRHLSMQYSPK